MTYELLSSTERDAIVSEQLRAKLPSLGLTERSVRSWIAKSEGPVRRLFEIYLMRGAKLRLCWGFSLDFVPHISAGRVRWHRTEKSALLDVTVDPRDLQQPSYLHGAARLVESLKALLKEVAERADRSWKAGGTFHGMLEMIKDIRERHTNRFDFSNYAQLPLAFAFLSAKTGDLETAEKEINQLILHRRLDEDEAAKLKKLAMDYAESSASQRVK